MTLVEKVNQLEKNQDTVLEILGQHTEIFRAITVRLDTVEAKVDGLSTRLQRIENEIGDIKPLLIQVLQQQGRK